MRLLQAFDDLRFDRSAMTREPEEVGGTVESVAFIDHATTTIEVKQMLSEGSDNPTLAALHRASNLCNDAVFDPLSLGKPVEKRLTQCNSTDSTILKMAEAAKPGEQVRHQYRNIAHVCFNSKNKFIVSMHSNGAEEKSSLLLIKSASDVLLSKCSR